MSFELALVSVLDIKGLLFEQNSIKKRMLMWCLHKMNYLVRGEKIKDKQLHIIPSSCEQTWKPLAQGCSKPSLIEIDPLVLE